MAYSHKLRRYSADSEWGEIFGLKSTELSDEQLKKISFNKLIEFIESDARAEKIAGDKLLTDDISSLEPVKSLSEEEIKSRPYFLSKYNEFVALRDKDIDEKANSWDSGRSKWVRWSLLNDENRQKEIRRVLSEKDSVVNLREMDYQSLYSINKYLANDLIKHVVKVGYTENVMTMLNSIDHQNIYQKYPEIGGSIILHAFKVGDKVLRRTVEKMPKEVFLAVLPKMFEQPQNIYLYALCSEYTPKGYALKALRAIGKRRNIPTIRTPITTSMLKELPPVLRLDVLESIMYNLDSSSNNPFIDLTEDDLRHILFTTSIRHNQRVDYVVSRFKQLKAKNNEQI